MKFSTEELKEILVAHKKRLNDEPGGRRANLEGANLEGANLREANLRLANLEGANLGEANLEEANLEGANLWRANLWRANLWRANLGRANLRGVNLREADLEEANLREANLEGANLEGAIGNRREIKNILIYPAYSITYTATYLVIGCEQHLIEDWRDFTDEEIREMDGGKATSFWSRNKDEIFSIIERNPAMDTKLW